MNRRKSIIYTSIFVLIIAVLAGSTLSLRSCFSTTISRTFFAADTVCTITVYDGEESALDGAIDLCNELASKFTCKDEGSELSQLNKNSKADKPSNDLLDILNKGLYYSNLKDGIFDITVKPISDLWDFKNGAMPDSKSIAAALPKVGYKNISISNNEISLKNGAEIDLGAIAKGYIADKISDFLIKNGVKSAIVNLGGNVTTIGKKGNEEFTVGIQNPFEDGIAATVKCTDMSVVTSGIYQRYFKKGNEIYHHLLNTKTGYPEQNELNSVTIISPSATNADALSTLCFLLGAEKGMELIEQKENTEAVFIDKNNKLILSSGLKQNGSLIEMNK